MELKEVEATKEKLNEEQAILKDIAEKVSSF